MSVDVSLDEYGHVILRNTRQPDPGQPRLVLTSGEWEEFLFRAASYQFERARLRRAPLLLPLADVLGDRLVLGAGLR